MNSDKPLKTLGTQAARLVTTLHDRGNTIFSNADVQNITGLTPKAARNFAAALVRRGVTTRLKPGLFILVPYELGSECEYMGNPFVVARELAGDASYYISHASAMELHQMVTQPQLVVYVTSPRSIRPRMVLGTEFRFVRCKPNRIFGITDHWATRTQTIRVSDLARTIIDGLEQSEYCGGFTEVAKGFWMRRDDIDPDRLVDYALRMNVGAVIRRLGFLLETFEVNAPHALNRLHERLTASYAVLDPMMPDEGKYLARWRLRLNVEPEELESVVRT
ncbi:MAG: transcriptional regulator [Gammaproteobacteria bacterium]|nr:MAG: transcriptional regulator [Gammaproteobacteria bacterium]